ncbi:MAG: tetratricopeptide repeat protein [Alphaproteobacteria bacterium]|nr:tetratricopeptide repeat protein [Alphaproteobacteria bacterium]
MAAEIWAEKNQAEAHLAAGQHAEAWSLASTRLAAMPLDIDALRISGGAAWRAGDVKTGEALFQSATQIAPDDPRVWSELGEALAARGDYRAAVTCQRKAVALAPGDFRFHFHLGTALINLLSLNEGFLELEEAVRLRPDFAHGHYVLGAAKQFLLGSEDAYPIFETAVATDPTLADAWMKLGTVCLDTGRHQRATEAFGIVTTLEPRAALAFFALALVKVASGRLEDGLADFIAVFERFPNAGSEASNALQIARSLLLNDFGLSYLRHMMPRPEHWPRHFHILVDLTFDDPDLDAEAAQALRKAWAARLPRHPPAAPFTNDPDPDRRLRIGFSAATFCDNSSVHLVRPTITHLDRAAFDITLYSMSPHDDAMTDSFRAHADRFVDARKLDDDAFLARVLEDRIDILVDIAGHSWDHRLEAMARRAAPVQMSAWGNPTGTGLAAVDYLVADPFFIAPDERRHFAETILDLPLWTCFEPIEDAPPVAPPPALANGYATFGSFHRLRKLTAEQIAAWAELLKAVPSARFLFKSYELDDPQKARRLRDHLAGAGIDLSRIDIVGGSKRLEHLALHARVDMVLDTYPHASGTTGFESMAMGVPVIAWRGGTSAGRGSGATLVHLGFPELVARSRDEYLGIAIELAKSPDRLAFYRRELPARLATRPGGNPRLYAEAFGAACRDVWRRWCDTQTPR